MKRLGLVFAGLILGASAQGVIAPSFSGELLEGGRTSLQSNLKPGRALLVCFWASWCVPCLEELRHVSEKLKKDPSLPLDVLAINVDTSETASDVRPTLKSQGFDFPVILDPKHEIFGKFQRAKQLPFSVLVRSTGDIAESFTGYQEAMLSRVKEALAKP